MSVKSCERLDKSKVALTIEADAAAFEAAINKAYLQQRSKISVPGFRPGKAPRKMIESMYGAEVFYEEAVNILLPDAYEAAVKEQELNVVGYPEVELESCTKAVSYTHLTLHALHAPPRRLTFSATGAELYVPDLHRLSYGCLLYTSFLMTDLFLQKRGQKHPGLLSENS